MNRENYLKYATTILKLVIFCALNMSATLALAAQGDSADELLDDAGRILQQFDSNRYAEVWQDAAPFVKAKIPQDKFVATTGEARHALGAVTRRGWASVTRIQNVGVAGVPDGLYANVDFASTLANGKTAFELLSFQLGADGLWHLTGYVPRLTQDMTAGHPGKP